MQYSFNNSRKIPKLAQFILGIYNNFYYKILRYFWGITTGSRYICGYKLPSRSAEDAPRWNGSQRRSISFTSSAPGAHTSTLGGSGHVEEGSCRLSPGLAGGAWVVPIACTLTCLVAPRPDLKAGLLGVQSELNHPHSILIGRPRPVPFDR